MMGMPDPVGAVKLIGSQPLANRGGKSMAGGRVRCRDKWPQSIFVISLQRGTVLATPRSRSPSKEHTTVQAWTRPRGQGCCKWVASPTEGGPGLSRVQVFLKVAQEEDTGRPGPHRLHLQHVLGAWPSGRDAAPPHQSLPRSRHL